MMNVIEISNIFDATNHSAFIVYQVGTVHFDESAGTCTIFSIFIFYGSAANESLAQSIAAGTEACWNEPGGRITWKRKDLLVRFHIRGMHMPALQPNDVWYNDDPVKNFFRVEAYSLADVSFVDGIGSNTGYFKLANLLQTDTTAAHEYGHTLGLEHPLHIDIRGHGIPGIMYPRGTVTDPPFLYNPLALPGDNTNGGTMNPATRKVSAADIAALQLQRLAVKNGVAVIGDFTSTWHEKHV